VVGPSSGYQIRDTYAGISGPSSIGTGGNRFFEADLSSGGERFGVFFGTVGNQQLVLPTGYNSGDPLSGTSTYSGETFSSLGISEGTYEWSWGADSAIISIGPCGSGDTDGDGIPDDGDGSGTAGDNKCTGGQTASCDDNCPNDPNPDQSDVDGDGIGDVCDAESTDLVSSWLLPFNPVYMGYARPITLTVINQSAYDLPLAFRLSNTSIFPDNSEWEGKWWEADFETNIYRENFSAYLSYFGDTYPIVPECTDPPIPGSTNNNPTYCLRGPLEFVYVPLSDGISSYRLMANHRWNWIPPWDPGSLSHFLAVTDIAINFSDALALIGLQAAGQIVALGIDVAGAFNSVREITYHYEGFTDDYDGVDDPVYDFDITVVVPNEKYFALGKSAVHAILGIGTTFAGPRLPSVIVSGLMGAVTAAYGTLNYQTAADPQPDYSQIATAEPIPIPEHCIPPEADNSVLEVAKLSSQLLGFETALTESYIRYDAAEDAQDEEAIALHLSVIKRYSAEAARVGGELSVVLANLLSDESPLTVEEIEQTRQSLLTDGVPEVEKCILANFGYSGSEITELGALLAGASNDVVLSVQDVPTILADLSSSLTEIDEVLNGPSDVITVEIDINPDSDRMCSDDYGDGVLPIVVYGDAEFDVNEIDTTTLLLSAETLGIQSDGQPSCTIEDANSDGYDDLVCEFMDDPSTWVPGKGMAGLTGTLQDGTTVVGGVDEICVNQPPNAAPTGGGVYEVGTEVVLGGSVADYDGDSLEYSWREGTQEIGSGTIQAVEGGDPVTLPDVGVVGLGLGAHILILEVSDGINDPVSSDITVEVVDTSVPTLHPEPSETILWPPNHQMVDIVIAANAADNSGLPPTLSVEVTSNEPVDGTGDGDMSPDWVIDAIDQVTGMISLQLRAERSGSGDGRVYTVAITATDDSDNSSEAAVEIIVPHDKGKKK
jgi:hypothetical protein